MIQPPEYSNEEVFTNIEHRVINIERVKELYPEHAESWDELDDILDYFQIAWKDLNNFDLLGWCLPYPAYVRVMELIDEIGPSIKQRTLDITEREEAP